MSIRALAANLTLLAPVLVVEDVPSVRSRLEGVLLQLGYPLEALAFAGSLAQARAHLEREPVSLALVDLGLPDGSGLELVASLRAADPGLGILVISAWSTPDAILTALRAGATGYVIKERDDLEMALALRSVLRGGAPIDPFIARHIIEELAPEPAAASPGNADAEAAAETLSQRELQILHKVAEGLGNREIAEQLHLSRYTVETHIKHIYRKLAVSTRTRAIHEARTRGLLK